MKGRLNDESKNVFYQLSNQKMNLGWFNCRKNGMKIHNWLFIYLRFQFLLLKITFLPQETEKTPQRRSWHSIFNILLLCCEKRERRTNFKFSPRISKRSTTENGPSSEDKDKPFQTQLNLLSFIVYLKRTTNMANTPWVRIRRKIYWNRKFRWNRNHRF